MCVMMMYMLVWWPWVAIQSVRTGFFDRWLVYTVTCALVVSMSLVRSPFLWKRAVSLVEVRVPYNSFCRKCLLLIPWYKAGIHASYPSLWIRTCAIGLRVKLGVHFSLVLRIGWAWFNGRMILSWHRTACPILCRCCASCVCYSTVSYANSSSWRGT